MCGGFMHFFFTALNEVGCEKGGENGKECGRGWVGVGEDLERT